MHDQEGIVLLPALVQDVRQLLPLVWAHPGTVQIKYNLHLNMRFRTAPSMPPFRRVSLLPCESSYQVCVHTSPLYDDWTLYTVAHFE